MASDARAQKARAEHRASLASLQDAARHRELRDGLVRTLRAEDPGQWSYTALAKAVGCSPELIAVIVKAAQPSR